MSSDPPTPVPPKLGPEEEHVSPVPALGPVPMERVAPPARRGRAGRDLVAAITVGVGLAAGILLSLLLDELAFVALVVVASVLGVVELSNALRTARVRVPMVPVLLGTIALPFVAYLGGDESLLLALSFSALAVLAWRGLQSESQRPEPLAEQQRLVSVAEQQNLVSDATAGIFCLLYVPFLASFAVLLVRPEDGPARVVTFILLTVLSDVGGYVAGVLFGRHPMAPGISPKKSWEGFAGSAAFSAAGGAAMVSFLSFGSALEGALVGIAVMLTATLGDLGESMIKRDIGVKDMGSLLPGHGGLMDRLDSLLPAAPVAYLLLTWIAPT